MPFPVQFQDASGDNLSGGTLEFYLAGTTTPTNLFSDDQGTSIGSSITLNSNGQPESGGNTITLFRQAGISLKIVAKSSGGTVLWTADDLQDALTALASTSNAEGAALVGIEDAASVLTAVTVEAALQELATGKLANVVEDTTPELGGNLGCQDNEVQKAEIKDYAVTHTAPSINSGAVTFDCESGNSFQVTLTENITAITLSNPPATGKYGEITIKFVQDGTGGWTVAGWPAGVKWAGGSAPTITSAAGSIDKVFLSTHDEGAEWLGDSSQDYS